MYPFLHIGTLTIRIHQIINAICFGILFLGVWLRIRKRHLNASIHDLVDGFFYLMFGALIGAWLASMVPIIIRSGLHVLQPSFWWMGGQQWLGALAGGILVGYFYIRRHKLPVGATFDLFAPIIPIAQGLGRIGCLLNGDAYGRPTSSWVGMWLPDVSGVWAYRYPTQLADMLADFLIAAILLSVEHYTSKKLNKGYSYPFQGFLFLLYVLLYCLQRFYFEFWRGDMPILVGAFTWTHLYILIALVLVAWGMVRGLHTLLRYAA